jgi:uncharacterized protein
MEKLDIVIFHYPCSDGGGGAFCAKLWCEEKGLPEPEYLGFRPGKPAYDLPDLTGKTVMMVDITLNRDSLDKIAHECDRFVLLDHHKTAEEDLKNFGKGDPKVRVIFDRHRSGAQIAWDYLFPDQRRPDFINYIADRDLWEWKYIESKPFSAAVFTKYSPSNPKEMTDMMYHIHRMSESEFCQLLEYGVNCIDFQDKQIAQECKKALLCKMKIPGINQEYKVYVSNSRMYRSEVGNILSSKEECDFAVIYTYNLYNNEWWVSMRADKNRGNIDVSKIGEHFPGGGGHACASGFTWSGHIRELLEPIKE